MGEPLREGQENSWVGRTLLNKRDIEEAWKEYDGVRGGERIFCKDKNGRILEITGGIGSPLIPLIVYTEWKNFGKDNEEPIENVKMHTPEFLALRPTVVDVEEEMRSRG